MLTFWYEGFLSPALEMNAGRERDDVEGLLKTSCYSLRFCLLCQKGLSSNWESMPNFYLLLLRLLEFSSAAPSSWKWSRGVGDVGAGAAALAREVGEGAFYIWESCCWNSRWSSHTSSNALYWFKTKWLICKVTFSQLFQSFWEAFPMLMVFQWNSGIFSVEFPVVRLGLVR